MEELIFFAVIIAFSIIESISRRRKAKAREGVKLPTPEEWQSQADAPEADDELLPTYDADRSYDDGVRGQPEQRYTRPHGTAARSASTSRSSTTPSEVPTASTGMTGAEVAADIWAEIAGLAGAKPSARVPSAPRIPQQSPPLPPKPTPSVSVRREGTVTMPSQRKRSAEHRIHLSHAGYGTDPSERAPSEQDGLDPLAETLGQDPSAIRAQLRSHGAHQLRQAIILQEVLSPPAAIREDRFDGWDLGIGADDVSTTAPSHVPTSRRGPSS